MTVTETLRRALLTCGESRYAVSKATGIDQASLSRFVHGQPLRGTSIDVLAEYLGLDLTPRRGRSKTALQSRAN